MELHTLSTGSIGNCYILSDNDGNSLVLDAGVKANDIKKALNFDFSNVDGVLISHSHKDHCLSADALETYGLDVWRPYLIENGRDRRTFGKWAVQSFDLPHDGCPNCGFYIKHINGFKMLYLTDLEYCKYNFRKQMVETILIEVNWQAKYLETAAENYRHKVLGHLSLENCIDFLKANKTGALQRVIICHMSGYTMDVSECVSEIKRELPDIFVFAAEKGRVNKFDFD